MPEYKVPKENKPKPEKENKPKHDASQVVSAYSEEGQRRVKKEASLNLAFKIASIALVILLLGGLIVYILWRGGVFAA